MCFHSCTYIYICIVFRSPRKSSSLIVPAEALALRLRPSRTAPPRRSAWDSSRRWAAPRPAPPAAKRGGYKAAAGGVVNSDTARRAAGSCSALHGHCARVCGFLV